MKCPRCGNEQVRGNRTGLPHGKEWDFFCSACGLLEQAFEDGSDAGALAVRDLRVRWGDLAPPVESGSPSDAKGPLFAALSTVELLELAACVVEGRIWERRTTTGRIIHVLDPRVREDSNHWRAWQPGTAVIERGARSDLIAEVEHLVRKALETTNGESHLGDEVHRLRLAHVGLLALMDGDRHIP